jgi:phage terminase large subunit-like protein
MRGSIEEVFYITSSGLRDHIANARAKLSKDEDSRLRIIKRAPNRKIDLAVAASMGVSRILYLNV